MVCAPLRVPTCPARDDVGVVLGGRGRLGLTRLLLVHDMGSEFAIVPRTAQGLWVAPQPLVGLWVAPTFLHATTRPKLFFIDATIVDTTHTRQAR